MYLYYKYINNHNINTYISKYKRYMSEKASNVDSNIKKWFYNNIYTLAKKHNVKDEMKYINNQIKQEKIFLLNDIINQ